MYDNLTEGISENVVWRISQNELNNFFYSSVFFFHFSVKSKKANLIRLILFQKLANKISPPPKKGNTLLFGLSFDTPVKE